MALSPFTIPIIAIFERAGIQAADMQALAVVIAIDFFLGFTKSLVLGTTTSRRIWKGIAGKVSVIAGILGIAVATHYVSAMSGVAFISGENMAEWLIFSAMAAEGVSIARNVVAIQTKKEMLEFNALAMIWTGVMKKFEKVFEAIVK